MPAVRRSTAAAAVLSTLGLTLLSACGSSASDGESAAGSASSAGAQSGGAAHVAVNLSGNACQVDTTSVPAGPVTFNITNQNATGISEVEILSGEKIVGERENLAPGLPTQGLTVTLGGGSYTLYCPGADTERTAFTVTGQAAPAATGSVAQLLKQGTDTYSSYVTTQVQGMVAAVQNLQQAVDAGDLAAAQKDYGLARPFYEKVESDVEGFVLPGHSPTDNRGNLDYLIDMRASNLDPKVGWSGFHAVERDLFQGKRITAQTKKYAADLTKNVRQLATLSKTLTYKPEDLANGAAGLLEEVQTNKISGEEEAFSHIDLVDVAANVEGAQQAFAALAPGLKKIDASLTRTIAKRFAVVDNMLDTYRDPRAIGGYRPYTAALKKADANKLSQAVQSLQDPLAGLAEKVATA